MFPAKEYFRLKKDAPALNQTADGTRALARFPHEMWFSEKGATRKNDTHD
jgi:hypothetical protein